VDFDVISRDNVFIFSSNIFYSRNVIFVFHALGSAVYPLPLVGNDHMHEMLRKSSLPLEQAIVTRYQSDQSRMERPIVRYLPTIILNLSLETLKCNAYSEDHGKRARLTNTNLYIIIYVEDASRAKDHGNC
jgi:hypothetical protein